MGFAFSELHWTPDQFWRSTVRELMSAYAFKVMDDEVEGYHEPFTPEERAALDEIKARV